MSWNPNETPLKSKLMLYDKESLKGLAQDLMIKGAYKMKKEELADSLSKHLLTPEVLFYRMAILSDRDISAFEKGCGQMAEIPETDEDFESFGRLNVMDLVVADHIRYFVPCDLAEAWKKVNTPEFQAYRKRASWVWRCLCFAEDFYGYIPVECLLDVINVKKGMRMQEEELYDIFDKFPPDQLWSIRYKDIFLATKYANDMDSLEALRRAQAGKPHYVPSVAEVEEFYETNALISEKPYQDIMKFFEKEMGMSKEEAHDLTLELFERIAFEDDSNGTIQWLSEQFVFDGEKKVRKIIDLYMPLANGTRMRTNCGYKPTELHGMGPKIGPGNMPVITAGSTEAAEMLKEIMPQLEKEGFKIDLDDGTGVIPVVQYPNGVNGPAKMTEKKVYPNDPCPCGSGMKYKKCCGRNK